MAAGGSALDDSRPARRPISLACSELLYHGDANKDIALTPCDLQSDIPFWVDFNEMGLSFLFADNAEDTTLVEIAYVEGIAGWQMSVVDESMSNWGSLSPCFKYFHMYSPIRLPLPLAFPLPLIHPSRTPIIAVLEEAHYRRGRDQERLETAEPRLRADDDVFAQGQRDVGCTTARRGSAGGPSCGTSAPPSPNTHLAPCLTSLLTPFSYLSPHLTPHLAPYLAKGKGVGILW